MVSISNFIGHISDMLNRMEVKEKSAEKSFSVSTVESKEAARVIFESQGSGL